MPIALAAEEFGEQRLVGVAVEQVDARDALAAGARGGVQLEAEPLLFRRQAMFFDEVVGFLDRELAHEVAVVLQRAVLAEENDLRGTQRFGDLDGHGVRVDAVGPAVAIEAERR